MLTFYSMSYFRLQSSHTLTKELFPKQPTTDNRLVGFLPCLLPKFNLVIYLWLAGQLMCTVLRQYSEI